MERTSLKSLAILSLFLFLYRSVAAQTPALPSAEELNRPFGQKDIENFRTPPAVYYPETWFHFIGGNVSTEGIKADLEAIKAAGISGIQLFHGQFGGAWPGVSDQIKCLSPKWDDAVRYTAEECRKLNLRFCMQNCPGWAMSGGPWIAPSNAMRDLVWSRTDIKGVGCIDTLLAKPEPNQEAWRDYRDIAVLAFQTPMGDTGRALQASVVNGVGNFDWRGCINGILQKPLKLPPAKTGHPYEIDVSFPKGTVLRTIELPSIDGMNHEWCYEPGIVFRMKAIFLNGKEKEMINLHIPESNGQDYPTFTIACPEEKGVEKYKIEIQNQHEMTLSWIRFYSAARENNWESAAGWTLRSIERSEEHPQQNKLAYLKERKIYDLTANMDSIGKFHWLIPKKGNWTILRIGHVNKGMRNGPAPVEATGWECDKLSEAGSNAHFKGYIGRLSDGPLKGGLLNGMVMDSWECGSQTWTPNMEEEFYKRNGYPLRKWLLAVMGYVIDDPEITARFLLDWKRTIGDLFANNFYGQMSLLAKSKGLTIQYETAAGDIFPADIMEYYKYSDIPMCEFWQPMSEGFVGSLNFKPIKPTASAAHLYGKPRVGAESFTSFDLTWDEHWEMLKEVANVNYVEGVTHSLFHTYTHNPRTDFLPPGTSFGAGIGTPFLRGETWWRQMPAFTSYLARCSYLLERGKPVSDVLWYLGDEINHKPDQGATFPEGFKYDYCNPDILIHRLFVKNGVIMTPEGLRYKVLWMPDNERMLPETVEKIYQMVCAGATVIGNAPKGEASLRGGEYEQRRFELSVKKLWNKRDMKGIYRIGEGKLVTGMDLDKALSILGLKPDVKGGALWFHRQIKGADWYFVCSPKGTGYKGNMLFHNKGRVEIWDPLIGKISNIVGKENQEYTEVNLDLPRAGCCFIVFHHGGKGISKVMKYIQKDIKPTEMTKKYLDDWTLHFPCGWGLPDSMDVHGLKPWKDLAVSKEGKAFSGTVSYTTAFQIDYKKEKERYELDLGNVDMIAEVYLNGKKLRTLWTYPYRMDLTGNLRNGMNTLRIDVTSTWYNRLVYDAGLPERERKTWTIAGPNKDSLLKDSGLIGPVILYNKQ